MKNLFVWPALAVVVLLSGCVSTGDGNGVHDPSGQAYICLNPMRISVGEFRTVVNEAIDSMLTSHNFQKFLKDYKAEKKDENAFPVMKLAKVRNDTNDPDLNVGLMTDLWKEALIKNKITFVMDEGMKRSDDFESGCVIPYDTKVEPARIILHTRVISIEELKDRAKVVSYVFLLEMGDIKNGMLIWSFKKQLAFVEHKP